MDSIIKTNTIVTLSSSIVHTLWLVNSVGRILQYGTKNLGYVFERQNKYLVKLLFSVRTVKYGPSLSSSIRFGGGGVGGALYLAARISNSINKDYMLAPIGLNTS